MTRAEAAAILRAHNTWRRHESPGDLLDDDVSAPSMGDPTQIGAAIDVVVAALEEGSGA